MSIVGGDRLLRGLGCYRGFARLASLGLILSYAGAPQALVAQANMAAITVAKSFVDATGQTVATPGGSAAGVSFTFTPSPPGPPATVITTNASGQAFGAVAAGTYVFQETTAAPGTSFLSASISQNGGPPQTLSAGAFPLSPGGSYNVFVIDQVSGQAGGTASLTIFVSLTTSSGQASVGPLNGYTYTLAGQNGLPTLTQTTNQLGQATFSGLGPGIYSLSEAPSPGATFASMTINGVSAQQQQPFQVQAGGTYNVNVSNVASGLGNIQIQAQVIDQSGQPVANANLSGFSFSLTGQAGSSGAGTTVVSSATGQATANLSPGAYTISEGATPAATLLNYVINGVPTQTGQFTVGLGQTTSITAVNRGSSASSGQAGLRSIALSTGCNNVSSTYQDGTSGQTVAGAIAPTSSVTSIWRFDNSAQIFRSAYFPPAAGGGVPPPVDVTAIGRLDPVFICVSAPSMLNEPNA